MEETQMAFKYDFETALVRKGHDSYAEDHAPQPKEGFDYIPMADGNTLGFSGGTGSKNNIAQIIRTVQTADRRTICAEIKVFQRYGMHR